MAIPGRERRTEHIVVCVLASLSLSALPAHPAVSRFEVVLDNGTSVTVDNASPWARSAVTALVLAADRSTQEDCPFIAPSYKGLFKTGDRIHVGRGYLAWFDYTTGDGVAFKNPPYAVDYNRSGNLAGWWSLDPSTPNFRFWKTGPTGCWNWAKNELIPGSASPRREQNWWDAHGPPVEHSLQVSSGATGALFSHYLARNSPNSQWKHLCDGVSSQLGVHYRTSARLTSHFALAVDVTDNDDRNGVANVIQSEVDYCCREKDILITWRLMPVKKDVSLCNLYVYLWVSYAQDMDAASPTDPKYPCDSGGPGSQWPGRLFGLYEYVRSSLPLHRNWSFGPEYSPGSIARLELGSPCSIPQTNNAVVSTPAFSVRNGSWIQFSQDPGFLPHVPRWQLEALGVPGSGSGAVLDPYIVKWDNIGCFHESHDGTIGLGAGRGPCTNPSGRMTLRAGKWYQASVSIRTDF